MIGAAILIIFMLSSICSAFDLSPANPSPGDKITLTGTASPSEEVSLRSSFTMNLPVAAGQYEYETSVEIPQKPNRFEVTARNVQDLNAGVKLGIWITKSFPASSGTASISHSDVPPGRYKLKMFGEALPGSKTVPVEVVAETKIITDSGGKYTLYIDTSGIPAGDYRVEGAGDAKTIRLGVQDQSPHRALQARMDGAETETTIRRHQQYRRQNLCPLIAKLSRGMPGRQALRLRTPANMMKQKSSSRRGSREAIGR